MKIKMTDFIDDYGENKDVAKSIRTTVILPCLAKNEEIEIDFAGVSGVTQSFIHALLADPIRKHSETVFDLIAFRNCSRSVQTIIEAVEEYMQESL